MNKHTPGPWEAYGFVVATANGSRISQTHFGENGYADAKLIAAAPDLLEALKMLSADHDWTTSDWDLRMKSVVDSAIAKATGN